MAKKVYGPFNMDGSPTSESEEERLKRLAPKPAVGSNTGTSSTTQSSVAQTNTPKRKWVYDHKGNLIG